MAEGAAGVVEAAPVLRIVGPLGTSALGGVRTVVAALAGESRFILDLSLVDVVDPAAMAGLASAIRALQRAGRPVCVVARGAVVPAALRAAGVDQVVPQVESVEEARVLLGA